MNHPLKGHTTRLISLSADGQEFLITFRYASEVIAAVKELPGHRWDPAQRQWLVTAVREVREALLQFAQRYGFTLDNAAQQAMPGLPDRRTRLIEASHAVASTREIAGLGGTLHPFQRAGVDYALRTQRTFIADEMGLGVCHEAWRMMS